MASKRTILGLVPTLILSFIAWALLLLNTISLPTTLGDYTPFYYVGSSINSVPSIPSGTSVNSSVSQQYNGLRLGIWGACFKNVTTSGYDYCSQDNHHGYALNITNAGQNTGQAYQTTEIESSWTRGLVVIVVAFVFGIVSFIVTLIPKVSSIKLVAAGLHFLTFLLTLIAFAIQIALFVYTRSRVNRVFSDASTMPGPSFYMTLVALPILLVVTVSLILLWRLDKRASAPASYYGGGGGAATTGTSYEYSGSAAGAADKHTYEMSAAAATPDADPSATGGAGTDKKLSSRQRVLEAFQKS